MRAARTLSVTLIPVALLLSCREPQAPTGQSHLTGPHFINNGEPTGEAFPNVGAILFDFDQNGVIDGNDLLCSGSLIDETAFLTAAHCLSFLPRDARLYVTFDPELFPAPRPLIRVREFHFDPAFGRDLGDFHDVGVLILPRGSTRKIAPLRLPPAGLLDDLAAQNALKDQIFLNVGYGVSANLTGIPQFEFDGVRKVSESPFMALQPNFLGLLMNTHATEAGGDCFGDSGSPKFFKGNTELIVAHVTLGDAPCRATSWSYRLDTPSARAFLGQFVALP